MKKALQFLFMLALFFAFTPDLIAQNSPNSPNTPAKSEVEERSPGILSKNPDQGSPLNFAKDPTVTLNSYEDKLKAGILLGYQWTDKYDSKNYENVEGEEADIYNLSFNLSGPVDEEASTQTLLDFDGLRAATSLEIGFAYMTGPTVVQDSFFRALFTEADRVIKEMSGELKKLEEDRKALEKLKSEKVKNKEDLPPNLNRKIHCAKKRINKLKKPLKTLKEARLLEIIALEDFPDDISPQNSAKSYREQVLAAHSNKRKVFGFNYEIGYQNFKYLPEGAIENIIPNLIMNPDEDPISVESKNRQANKLTAYFGYMPGKWNLLESNTYIGFNYIRQSFFEPKGAQEVCVDQVTADGISLCTEHIIGAPVKSNKDQLQFEFRKLIQGVGLNIRFTYDLDESQWALSAPVYFISKKNELLPNAGMALHYDNKDKEAVFSFFIGQPFKLF